MPRKGRKEMKVYTSYFSNPALRSVDAGRAVAISVGVPRNFRGRRLLELAPTRAMLKMPEADYNMLYEGILSKLVLEDLGLKEGDILLCWEGSGKACHRHMAAAWLREQGIEVTEFPAGDSLAVGQQTLNL